MKIYFFVFLLVLFYSCNQGEIEYYRDNNPKINIYIVKEGQLELHESITDLDTLELENNPWVQNTDIEFYDWSAQTFYLNKEVEKEKFSGRHFVVTSDDNRLFAGVFFPMYLSSLPTLPSITPDDGFFGPTDVIGFGHFGTFRPGELDKKMTFKSELIAAGHLREGIEIELINVKKQNSKTLQYTFKITNKESDNIYVLDPDKMGSSRFHYFTNGISIMKNNMYYWPQDFQTIASETIKSQWYYKLAPGKSISRSVEIDGYTSLPDGKVKATFRFPGANLKNPSEWKKSDGRIWLGEYYCEKEITL